MFDIGLRVKIHLKFRYVYYHKKLVTQIQVINILKLMITCKCVNMTHSVRTLTFSEQELTKYAQNATIVRA